MKRFVWKRKVGESVNKTKVSDFSAESKEDLEGNEDGDIDWLTGTIANKKQCISLEDTKTKSERLIQEGAMLAEAERP
ncbi:tetratricopeptide repeat protein 33 [Biomphalaria pfeifferi]|uniref:Tetratricopeptide repeat protein 33 n=1 Tax=Biomphalaria pfeifferi TaxID=112525 RepID=A0AAD8EUC9_BIOPF|nr:tetratricopeptide repeat protein 33 [Biomphalaria pfeifferi]